MENAFWKFRLFDVYAQCFPDSLHMADTGVFEHILTHCLASIKQSFDDALGDDDGKRWKEAMNRLQYRLQRTTLVQNEGISNFVARVGHRVTALAGQKSKVPLFKASEFRRLMLVY